VALRNRVPGGEERQGPDGAAAGRLARVGRTRGRAAKRRTGGLPGRI